MLQNNCCHGRALSNNHSSCRQTLLRTAQVVSLNWQADLSLRHNCGQCSRSCLRFIEFCVNGECVQCEC